MGYAMSADCLFCRIVRREIPATIVAEDEHCVAFRDIGPQAPTHVLVIPRQHVSTLDDVTDPLLIGRLMLAAAEVAVALAIVLGVGAAVSGLVAVDTRSRFETANDGSNAARAEDLRSTGQTLNVLSDILLVGTLVGAAVTTYLYVTRPTLPSSSAQTYGFTLPRAISGRF